ncbi:phage tail protein [Buttiauxella gaviniae]|uniref:phage tail fiber protein n=1 Tax=Buttiauxella gaviniae TaxID=82990 RepID=UPI003C78427C
MPAGTITLTNNSTAVTGSGTAFATELKANDFLVAVVGGTTYTLGVKSVESATALTLTTAYGGPTTSGLAWTPIPNGTLVGITAQIAADTARAIRGLNYDKQNWQQVYSSSGNITVALPDGSTWTGPSWKYLSDNMATKVGGFVPVAQGGTGGNNGAVARLNLELCGNNFLSTFNTLGEYFNALRTRASTVCRNDGNISVLGTTMRYATGFYGNVSDTHTLIVADYLTANVTVSTNTTSGITAGTGYGQNVLYGTANTTVDASGSIKKASPVVKVFSSGDFEVNNESDGCRVRRLGAGEYLIEGCMGLNADAAWGGIDGGFEIPVDRNKQPRIWLDYEINADGSILVKTYHRTHPDAPVFARNEIDGVSNGDPFDIPDDSFISVRIEMPENSVWNQKLVEKKHNAS